MREVREESEMYKYDKVGTFIMGSILKQHTLGDMLQGQAPLCALHGTHVAGTGCNLVHVKWIEAQKSQKSLRVPGN